jgi:hypothetical protein
MANFTLCTLSEIAAYAAMSRRASAKALRTSIAGIIGKLHGL